MSSEGKALKTESVIRKNWDKIKETVRNDCRLTYIAYKIWIDPLFFDRYENDVAYVVIPSDNVRVLEYIKKQFGIFFEVSIGEAAGLDYVTVEFVQQENDSELEGEEAKRAYFPIQVQCATLPTIVAAVAEQYGIDTGMLMANKRSAEAIIPKQLAIYLCSEYTDNTLEGIGKELGYKNNSTVKSGVERIGKRLLTDEELKKNMEAIRVRLDLKRK
jgi:hypothetical protein